MAKNIINGITLSIKNPLDKSQGISVSIDTPYQKNVAKVEEPKQEEWTTRSMLARIDEIGKSDPDKAKNMLDSFSTLQQDPTSKYYNPYALATNRSVANLAAYGVDTGTIDDAFFENNKYLLQYLTYDGTTNTPTKPGKKATAQQKAAYEYYQIMKSEAATKKAEQQWSALQQELNYWANRKDLNLSDDEIIGKINWNNYGELTSMDKNKSAQPNEYNRAIGYSQDALYGVIWQARNPDYTGSIYGAMANSYNGVGNVWQYNEEIAKKRDPNSPEFNPYSLGSVGIDDACLYYGVNSFDENWLNEHREDAFSSDSTRKSMYSKVYTAIQNTKKAEEAVEVLRKWIAKNSKNWVDEGRAKEKIDAKLADGKIKLDGKEYDISILNKMDASMGKEGEPGSGSMVSTTKAVNYKYDQMLNGVYRIVEGNKNRKNGTDFADSVATGSTTNAQTGEQTGETVYKTDSETNAIVNAENVQLQEAAGAMEDADLTKAEQAAIQSMSWSGAFGIVKGTADKIKNGIGIPVDSETMVQAQAKTVSDLSTAVLDGAGLMQEYNLALQDKEKWEAQKAELEEAAGLLADKAKWQKAGFSLESWNQTGGDITAQPAWDLLTDGQKSILTAMAVDSGEAEIAEEFDSFIALNRKEAGELTEEEQNTLNNYQDAVNFIAKDQKYMDDNQKAYDEAVRKQEQAMEQYRDTIEMLKASGADTQKMEDAYNVTQFFTQFTQYDPTQWTAYNMFHEYSMAAYAGDENWDALYKEAQGYDKEIAEMITLGEWSLMYAERNGIVVPDGIKENVQRWIDSMRREHEDFQYLELMDDMGFQEDAEKGKQKLIANSEKFDWEAYQASGGIEGMPLFYMLPEETKQDLIRLDERYKNHEQNAIEMVDEYLSSVAYFDLDHRTFNNLGFVNGATNAADIMTDYEQAIYYFLLETQGGEAAEKYYQHLADSSYGVLNTRAAEMTKSGADALAESGFWGRRAADVISMLLSPVAAVGSLYYMADTELRKLRGERVEINPNNVNLTANIYKKEARAKIQEEINETYKDNPTLRSVMSGLQEIISNRGDSLVNAIAFGPLFSGISNGIASEFMSALPMAFTAATDAVADAKEKGANDTQLLGVFLATMLAEAGTETISIHNIKSAFTAGKAVTGGMMKQFLINWLTESGMSEMVGESLNDLIEDIADEKALGDLSDFKQAVERYMTEDHMSEEDAYLAARRDQAMSLLHTALISYLSPGLDIASYGAGALKTLDTYRRIAKQRQKLGYSESMFELMRRDREAMEAAAASAEEETGETAPEAEPAAETAPETAPEASPATAPETAPVSGPAAEAAATVATKTAPATAPVIAGPVAADYSLLESVKDADAASKSAVVASVIDTEGTEESGDVAMAVASNLDLIADMVSDEADSVSFVEKMLVGANKAGIDSRIIKQAITNGALSINSAAWHVMLSDEFQAAGVEQKAQMLAETVVQDAASTVVQKDIETSVHEDRVARAIREPVVAGGMKPVMDAYGVVRAAQQKAQNAREQRDTVLGVVQAKEEALQDAQAVYDSDPSNKTYQGMLDTAVNELEAAHQVLNEYDQMVEKAEQEQAEAEGKLKAAQDEAMKTVREQAEATVAEEDAARAQAKAEAEAQAHQQAEQEAQIAQEQAKAQAEEDQRTGKTEEDRGNDLIETILDSEELEEGEERDKRREELQQMRDKIKLRRIKPSTKLSNAEGMLALYAFSRKIGIDISVKDLPDGVRGEYIDGKIYLNKKMIKSGNMSVGQALVEAALHEIPHAMENTKAYQTYRSVVLESLFGIRNAEDAKTLYETNPVFRAQIDQVIQDRTRAGDKLGGDDLDTKIARAEKEIVADFARLHLADKDVVQRFMDAGMGGNMRNILHNINQAIKNFVDKSFGRSYNQWRENAEQWNAAHPDDQIDIMSEDEFYKQVDYLRKAERAYQKAMNELAKTEVHPEGAQYSIAQVAQATGMRYDADKLVLYDKDGNEIDGVEHKITPGMIRETPVGHLIYSGLDLFDGENSELARQEAEKGNTTYIDPTSTAGKAIEMMTGLMNMIARYKQSDLVWEIGASTLASTFSAMKANSDKQYKTTVDFGTICAKTQAIIDVMSEVMMSKIDPKTGMLKEGMKPGLTRKEIMQIYNATHNADLSVPCPVCYVFSRWMGVPSLLGQMSQFQKDHVVTVKDENGNTVYDENGNAVIDWDKTQKHVDEYLEHMHTEYGDKDAINDKKTRLNNKMKSLEEKRNALELKLLDKNTSKEEKETIRSQIEGILSDMVDVEDQLAEVRAYNWVTQALCDKNGKVDREHFRITPDNILFDLNRTSEFAEYEKNWTYRNTRGAGMGKAIMPYSGETIGDVLYGVNQQNKGRRQNGLKNPWLHFMEKGFAGKAMKQLRDARARAKKQNLLGGQRLQSTSDFRPEWGLDYIMSFLELQAAGSKVQMYTKVAEAVDFFASVGADVNLSIMGQGTGWHVAQKGEIEKMSDAERAARVVDMGGTQYVMDFSPVTGMKYFSDNPEERTATSLKNLYDNVQMILVGMNDTHIRLAMANPNIDFIIPWHSSGNSKDVLSNLISAVGEKLNTSVDYTTTQSDMKKGETKHYYDENGEKIEYSAPGEQTEQEKQLWDLRMRILTGKANKDVKKGGLTAEERKIVYGTPWLRQLYDRFYVKGVDDDCYGVALSSEQASQIFPFEYWATGLVYDEETHTYKMDPNQEGARKETADANGKRFVDYCNLFGIIPRFSQFKDDPGYWKLLIDRPMYNNDGTYHRQQTINVTNARVGELDENGKLIKESSDLPTQAQARYAPKDKRNPMYEEYRRRTENAVKAAQDALGIPYTDEQSAAIEDAESIQDAAYRDGVDPKLSVYGEDEGALTEADLDVMEDSDSDEEYMAAVERGDTDAEQKMVDEAAKRAGYEEILYHGTNANFTSFDLGEEPRYGNSGYGFYVGDSLTASAFGGKRMKLYVDTRNLARKNGHNITADQVRNAFKRMGLSEQKFCDYYGTTIEKFVEDGNDWRIAYYMQDFSNYYRDVFAKKGKKERIPAAELLPILRETLGVDGLQDDSETVLWDNTLMKSADPVTYNDEGNVIPLSERFQRDNQDIRYSTEGELTEADIDTLVGAGVVTPQEAAEYRGKKERTGSVKGMINDRVGYTAKDGYIKFDNAPNDNVIKNLEIIGMIYDPATRTWSDKGPRKLYMDDIIKAVEDGEKGIVATVPNRTRDNPESMQMEPTKTRAEIEAEEVAAGVAAPLEGYNPGMSTAQGPAIRAFAAEEGMLVNSDELDRFAKAAVLATNTYFPDTNAEQIHRAVKWIRSLKQAQTSDGYAESVQAVTDPSFDYRSADGQARMVAVMAMAVAKNDVMAQAALTDSFMRQGTDLGRALQARKMFLLMTPQGRIQSLQNTMRGLQQELDARGYKGNPLTLSEWIYAAASVAENPEDFSRVQEAAAGELAEQMPVSWKDKLRSWRMLSMLMNTRTHIRNIVGNMLFVPAVGIKNKLAAVMELGVKKGNKTKTLSPFLSKEARDFARADAKKQKLVLKGEAKYGQETKVKQQQKVFGNGKTILSKVGGGLLNALSKGNSWALEGEDWIFLKGHYRRALGGWMMANGYTAAQLEANPQLLEKGRAYAIQEAKKATYRDFNQLAQTLNQVSRKGGAAGFIVDAVLPFKKTPANILKRGLEYSPAGIVKNLTADLYHLKQYMDYQNGKLKALPTNAISPTQFIDNLCSGLTGSAIMAAGFLLANTGIVRCGLKDDDDEFDKLEGAQEYSFEISIGGYDVSFTMDWAAPMSMPFFVGAAIQNQLSKEGEIDVQEVVNAISNIAEPVFNLSMLDGVNTVFKTSQNDDTTTITQILAKIGSNYATSYVPSALGAYTRATDPIRRKAYVKSGEGGGVLGTIRYAIEQTENKLPGYSETNIPVRDAFGRITERPEWQRWLESFILPGYVSFKETDPVVEEHKRLYQATGNKKMIPSLPDRSFQAGGETIRLDDKQYDQLTLERGETLYNLVQELKENEYYKSVPAEDQAAMIEDAWTYATQNAKYNINPNANVDKWVLNSRTNPVQGIINRRKDKIDAEYIAGYKQGALEAVRDGSNANLDVCLEKLEEAGVNNPEGTVKTYVANAYRPEYIRAYQDGDSDKMNEIEVLLINSDLDFDDNDFEKWIENMYKQTATDEDEE